MKNEKKMSSVRCDDCEHYDIDENGEIPTDKYVVSASEGNTLGTLLEASKN